MLIPGMGCCVMHRIEPNRFAKSKPPKVDHLRVAWGPGVRRKTPGRLSASQSLAMWQRGSVAAVHYCDDARTISPWVDCVRVDRQVARVGKRYLRYLETADYR